jgi:hypothetical protein
MPAELALAEDQFRSQFDAAPYSYMGRRLSMLSIFESVELRPFPLSLTRSLMRMLGLLAGCELGGGVVPSLRGGGGCRLPFVCGGG